MSNLYGIGLSGLSAAQTALSTTSNNISNVNTPGYTRETTQLAQRVSSGGGNGVNVTGIRRNYAQFLTHQLNAAQSKASATTTHLNQVSQIDNLLGDSSSGLPPLMQAFFSGVQTVAGDPEDTAARASLLGNAKALASQFQAFAGTLDDMGHTVDNQLQSTVAEVNTNTRQIADLNHQITLSHARTGNEPNRLLDQRDQLIAKLGKLVNVETSKSEDGRYNITVAGQSLVDANGSHELTTTASPDDSSRQVVAYKAADGNLRPIADRQITGGTIGGLLSFRDRSLQPTQLQLGQLAHDFATAVNKVQAQGKDLNGQAGQNLFTTQAPTSQASTGNTGNASLAVSFTAGGSDDVAASNYRVTYSQGQYQVTQLSNGNIVATSASPSLSFGGLDVSISGTPDDGDSFLIKPLANAASGFGVSLSDPAKIAAAGVGGAVGDNSNARALADLQNAKTVNGNSSFNDSYARLVGDIGNQANSLQVTSDSQSALTDELTSAQQSVSGVNLDEENVNLLYYQQMYQANAKVIQTASTLLDTLLSIAS